MKQAHEELTRKISGKNSHIYRVEKLNKEFEAELEGHKLKITQLQKDLSKAKDEQARLSLRAKCAGPYNSVIKEFFPKCDMKEFFDSVSHTKCQCNVCGREMGPTEGTSPIAVNPPPEPTDGQVKSD